MTAANSEVLISTATYNERDALPRLYERVRAVLPDTDLLVIDDNSPDGTGDWVREQQQQDPQLRCIHRSGKLGLGTASIRAMEYAEEHGYRYLINMDADLSHDPKYLPALIAEMESAGGRDIMIGSRYVTGGGTEGWPWHRRWMSRMVNTYARLALRLPVRDCSGGYRCFRCETVSRLELGQIRSTGYSFHEEVLWQLKRVGARFGETPIVFVDRAYGKSKINLREAWTAVWIIFRLGLVEYLGRRD